MPLISTRLEKYYVLDYAPPNYEWELELFTYIFYLKKWLRGSKKIINRKML